MKILHFIALCFIIFLCISCWKKNDVEISPPLNIETTIKDSTKNQTQEIVEIPIDYDTTKWTNIRAISPDIKMDIRYATQNNFTKQVIYDCPECYLRPEVAKALIQVDEDLKEMGYGGIMLFDCYRPRPYQQKLWDIVPDPRYVSNPKKGSMHTRGAAVDLTIIDKYYKNLNMGTDFDYFGKEAYHSYPTQDSTVRENRQLLKTVMYKRGFKHISTEWWHYSYVLKNYTLSDWVWNCDDVE